MKIEVEISDKLEKHIPEILEHIKAQNNGADVTIEILASHILKQQLIQIYTQILNN